MANSWLAVGSPDNWKTAFEHQNIWGLKETQRHLWDALRENDLVFLYATQPVMGIIGYGVVRTKFMQNQPLWPQEIHERRLVWPLRFEFDVEFCLPPDKWATHRITSDTLKLRVRRGFQPIESDLGRQMVSELKITPASKFPAGPSKLEVKETAVPYVPGGERVEQAIISHEELKQKLVEIGKLQNYLAEAEYSFDIGRLDVVWRRVQQSVPTYVFEVHVGGDVYHALAKLKHAFDLWNSHIFVVARQADYQKVQALLSGTFHEIGSRLKFIELEKIEELYKRKRAYLDLEEELGI